MDKLERHLEFLKLLFPDREEDCQLIFKQKKRNLRKALPLLLQPQESAAELLEAYSKGQTDAQRLDILGRWLHCYCPNASYNKILKAARKGKPLKLESATLQKLKIEKNNPRKEDLEQIFFLFKNQNPSLIVALLKGLKPFGRPLLPFWSFIDNYARHSDKEIVKAALELLVHIPQGIPKSIMTLAVCLQDDSLRITVLSALQNVQNLPSNMIVPILQPLVEEYRRLLRTEGTMNNLWPEFRLIKVIYNNNGISLSLPTIGLGRI